MQPMSSEGFRPIVIVTGANSGVGLGICRRLLFQLSSTSGQCEDALPKYAFHNTSVPSKELHPPCDGLTLILACRSRQRAEAAKRQLYDLLDEHVLRLQCSPNYDGHAEKFRQNVDIAIHTIDLARVRSVFDFADEVAQTYPYVSHLICNAGVACFTRIDWPVCFSQLTANFIDAVTYPKFFLQSSGRISDDGLGWLWQCNVFGHYVLFRAIEPLLAKCTGSMGSRVIWISSHEALSERYDPKDWQLIKSNHSYQSSKYQLNLMVLYLDQEAMKRGAPRHFTMLPGVAGTNIANALLGPITYYIMYMAFYVARFLGSPYHPISTFKAAIAAVHVALVPLAFLPTTNTASGKKILRGTPKHLPGGILYVSETDRLGNERVGIMDFVQPTTGEAHALELMENCDRLLRKFCDVEGRKSPSG
ncbi:NAD(P)-binding protein [Scleroderma citrinum]